MRLNLDDHFNRELPADPEESNRRRQVHESAFSFTTPRVPTNPGLLHVSPDVAAMIGLSIDDTESDEFLRVFSGAVVPDNAKPYAMCYGGHQFGNWAGQLGDGRAINMAEVSHNDQRYMLQLKGAGETPYSRTADGLAVLRSSLREHLCSEAMHHLGVPTTRSLSLMTTGDEVMRDVMYDGHPAYEPGAVVCRIAPSFIRFGNFQIFASRGEIETLRTIADYTIKHHYPESGQGVDGYVAFFREVSRRTLAMIVHWQRVGFVHGVMNTDNLSILGETIDYGPYGWLEGYDHNWTPNTTDRQHHRYRFGSQPEIALWNLVQLANALFPLVDAAEPFQEVLAEFQQTYPQRHAEMMAAKLGLDDVRPGDTDLIQDLDEVLQLAETDMTIFFRQLASLSQASVVSDDRGFLKPIDNAFYTASELTDDVLGRWRRWLTTYRGRITSQDVPDDTRKASMNAVNPKYVLRNYMAQLAIDKAEAGDTGLLHELYELLCHPYDEQPQHEKWFAKRPEWARHKVGCSMLSCSS